MRDLPVVMDGFRLTVVDPPMEKTREDDAGNVVTVTDREGATQYVVSLFAKQRVERGQRAPKGEEIKVTLATDPGMGFEEDIRVELIGPVINPYSIESGGRTVSGIAFKAVGMKLAVHAAAAGRGKSAKDSGSEGEQ